MGKVLIVANQKGGVGKSTTCHALMYEFAHTFDKKILVIDYDPQMTLTALMDIEEDIFFEYNNGNTLDAIFQRKEPDIIEIDNNIDFIPGTSKLISCFESAVTGKEKMLSRYLKNIKHDYDYILIDTRPDMGTALVSSFLAADVIINTIATGAIEELATQTFYEKLDEVLDLYEFKIKHIIVLPTMHTRLSDAKESLYSIQENLPVFYYSLETLKDIPLEILEPIPHRAVFKNAAGARVGVRKYIKMYDTSKKDLLLILENITKKIIMKVEKNG